MTRTSSARLGGRGATAWQDTAGAAVGTLIRRRRRVSSRVRVIAAASAGALVLSVGVMWWAPFLQVHDVDIQGASAATASRIRASATIHQGEPLVEVDPSAVADRIRATGLVSRVDVARRWPSSVAITVTERVPVLAWPAAAGSVRLVDASGVPFDTVAAHPARLPVVHLARPSDPAQLAAAAAAVAALTTDQRARVRSIDVGSSGIVTMHLGKLVVVWGDSRQGELKAQVLSSLQRRPGLTSIDISAPATPALKEADRGS